MGSLHSNVHFSVRLTHEPCLQRGGEEVLYLDASKKKVQITDKFFGGIFLGIKEGSDEFIVGTPAGCVVCRNVKRRLREDAADTVFFNSIRGTPRDFCQTSRENPESQESNCCESMHVLCIQTFIFQSTRDQPSHVECVSEI